MKAWKLIVRAKSESGDLRFVCPICRRCYNFKPLAWYWSVDDLPESCPHIKYNIKYETVLNIFIEIDDNGE